MLFAFSFSSVASRTAHDRFDTCLNFQDIERFICGGLAVILGLLSKGNDKAMLPNAKVGVLTAILGIVVNVLVVGSVIIMLFTNPSYKEDFHRQLNQYSEYFYGESFDDMWNQIEEGTNRY